MSTEIITAAVAPLREAAIADAVVRAHKMLDWARTMLEEGGWDLNVVAPRPNGNYGREEYLRAQRRCQFFSAITEGTAPFTRPGQPNIRVWDEQGAAYYIEEAKKDAAISYDVYVAKLVSKVGAATAATLSPVAGDDLWECSMLTVTGTDGVVRRWKTQRIINHSGLGKLFFQWPTRLMK